ncbi:MAG: FecR family protein, partial [Lachnospiraceae bacterium]|nr:FecR family protein [Lachnospiraceae bacterium]
MNKKALLIGGCALAVVAIVVALIFIFTGGEDAYRSIKVFEIDGSCKVDRDGDSLDAFKNMALSSGDSLTVGEGSFARLKLDDDKYVYLEANTKINLTATGTANDSKTMVYIERGSMLTEVKKKLSATSSYDIVTPNTTMSIRGTKTLTQVLENTVTGHVQTSNAVLEGQVKIKAVKVKADGTVVSVEKDLGAGEGNAFSSNKEELVSQEEMKSIADTGASVNGIKVEIVSEEEAKVTFDIATFEDSFLKNIRNILIEDAENAAGEEGLSQEEIDTINSEMN